MNLEFTKEEVSSDISKKEVRKKILNMILPITGESMLQMAAGFISMAMIGRIEGFAAAALGLSMRITQMVWALFKGVSTGAAVFVAQSYGANNMKKIKHVIIQTLISSTVLVLILQQFIYWKGSFLLNSVFKNSTYELRCNALAHLKIASIGLPFLTIMLVVGAVLQAMGNAKTPMLIAIIMNVLNVIFSYIFIFGKVGIPTLGLKGAAIGLVIAQIISAIIGLYVLFNKNGVLAGGNRKKVKVDMKQVCEIYMVGIPAAMESIFWQLAAIFLTNIILSYGEVVLSAYQVALQAESVSYMPAVGFGVAATAFIGQCIGARDEKLGKIYMKEIVLESTIVTIFSSILLIFFPALIMKILTNNKEVINIGVIYLVAMGIVQIPQNLSGVLNGALRGAGYTKVPMMITAIGIWVVRIFGSFIFAVVLHKDVVYIWIIIALDLVVRFILSVTIFKRRDVYKGKLVDDEVLVQE